MRKTGSTAVLTPKSPIQLLMAAALETGQTIWNYYSAGGQSAQGRAKLNG
jgi:hypothetical protein